MMDGELVEAVAAEVVRRLAGAAPVAPEYLTLRQAARLTGFSYDYVWDAVKRNDLPAVRKGKEVRVAAADARRWMDRDKAAPAPSRPALREKVSRYLPGV